MQTCPICEQPIEGEYHGADVYHMECMIDDSKDVRKQIRLMVEKLEKLQKGI